MFDYQPFIVKIIKQTINNILNLIDKNTDNLLMRNAVRKIIKSDLKMLIFSKSEAIFSLVPNFLCRSANLKLEYAIVFLI